MSIRAVEQRRVKLMQALAVAGDGRLAQGNAFWFSVSGIAADRWVQKTYSLARFERGRPQLYDDLEALRLRGWIEFDASDDAAQHLEQDPTRWSVGLKEEGVKAALEFATPHLVKAYWKEPIAAIALVVTFLLAIASFFAGWWLQSHLAERSLRAEMRREMEPRVREELRAALAPVIREELVRESRLDLVSDKKLDTTRPEVSSSATTAPATTAASLEGLGLGAGVEGTTMPATTRASRR